MHVVLMVLSDMIYGRGLESINSVNFLKTTLDLRNYLRPSKYKD